MAQLRKCCFVISVNLKFYAFLVINEEIFETLTSLIQSWIQAARIAFAYANRVRQSLLRTRFSVADFGGFFKNRVRKIAYANRVAYAKSSRAGRDLRTRFSICVRDFCWDFTECDLRTLGAICVRDLRTRFAYATRFCVRDLRTRRDFSSTAIF